VNLTLNERLLWTAAILAGGALLPAVEIYWVASHNLRIPPAQTLETIADYYSREFDSLAWAAIWHFPPFVLLAIVSLFVSRRASRLWHSTVVFVGVILITLPLVPRSIHLIKDTYRRDNWGDGAEYAPLALCIMSCFCLCVGMAIMTGIHRCLSSSSHRDASHLQSTGNG